MYIYTYAYISHYPKTPGYIKMSDNIRALIEAHITKAYAVAYRLTSNESDACDLVQETFIRVIEKQHLYNTEHNFGKWLNQVLYRVYLNKRRGRDRRREVSLEPLSEKDEKPPFRFAAASCEMPDNIAESCELKSAILSALDSLPAEMRVCVNLVDIEGYSYEEAAEIMDCSAGTIACWLFRGRRLLRRELKGFKEE